MPCQGKIHGASIESKILPSLTMSKLHKIGGRNVQKVNRDTIKCDRYASKVLKDAECIYREFV